MNKKLELDISIWTVTKIILVLIAFFLLYRILDIIGIIFISFILVAAFKPVVEDWSKKLGRPFSVLLLILIFLLAISGFVYLIIPPFVEQSKQLIQSTPDYLNRLSALRAHYPQIESVFSRISDSLGGIATGFISITAGFFGGVVSFITVLVLTIYFLIDQKIFTDFGLKLIPENNRQEVGKIIERISQKVGDWLRGQLILGLVVGVLTFLGLSIIGIRYALALGVVAGLLEIIPIIGPIISGVLGTIIALTVSPITAVIVAIFYIVVQQLENHILVPKIMQKAIGLPPAIIIIAVLIGGKLLGILGALLAVPISGIIYVLIQELPVIKSMVSTDE